VADDDMLAFSNELAYKILLSFFPFMLFLVSLLGFLNLEDSHLMERMYGALPGEISGTVSRFMEELRERRSAGLLSAGLLMSVYSASNGFRAVMSGVNKAHGYRDERGWIKKTALCAALMLIFTCSIVVMLVLWIFSDAIVEATRAFLPFSVSVAAQWVSAIVAWVVLVGATAWIYHLACSKGGNGWRVLPGACATVTLWAISSEVLALFFMQYSNIPLIYGSIAGMFMLVVWLNLVAFFLLLGNAINALIWRVVVVR